MGTFNDPCGPPNKQLKGFGKGVRSCKVAFKKGLSGEMTSEFSIEDQPKKGGGHLVSIQYTTGGLEHVIFFHMLGTI